MILDGGQILGRLVYKNHWYVTIKGGCKLWLRKKILGVWNAHPQRRKGSNPWYSTKKNSFYWLISKIYFLCYLVTKIKRSLTYW